MSMGRGGLQKYMGYGNNPIQNGGMGYGNIPNNSQGNMWGNGQRDDSHSLFSNKTMGLMGAGSLAGSLISGLFNNNDYHNPADAASSSLDKISDDVKDYDPYISAGHRAMTSNEDLYNQLINNPGDSLNKIGQSYHQSPGYQYALQQGLANTGNSLSARGMLGTNQSDMERMRTAEGLANQDYDTWLQHALGLHQQGMEGRGHLQDTGYNATNERAQDLMNQHLSQANLAYEGQNTSNQQNNGFGQVFSSVIGALPFLGGL